MVPFSSKNIVVETLFAKIDNLALAFLTSEQHRMRMISDEDYKNCLKQVVLYHQELMLDKIEEIKNVEANKNEDNEV